ncbi:Ankyrin repeat and MYND domaincontaining protein 2like [Caligus rogercresseyi]|uniref:Ankyrin repeat and MYND domaincontaining protein 2like n=1 Tax=Caligus rogercresseyi TaxID=217165 RepID=A0A7T8KJD4_CALRO|nr:Ankyrin repeat and MYND domaincontaining protein 2like [Caligus rogercresseyi]
MEKPESAERIIQLIQENAETKEKALELVRGQFEIHGRSPDLQDASGMTLLMHAAWTDNLPLTAFLLSQGADPNGGADHEHGYKALHFAALKGCPIFVWRFLRRVRILEQLIRSSERLRKWLPLWGCMAPKLPSSLASTSITWF